MVNAVLDYILLLDRLVIKLLIYVAEHDYNVYICMIGPLIIFPLLDIIDNKYQNIQLDKHDNIDEFVKVKRE